MKAKTLAITLVVVLIGISFISGIGYLQAYAHEDGEQEGDQSHDHSMGRGWMLRHELRWLLRSAPLLPEDATIAIEASGKAYRVVNVSQFVDASVVLEATKVRPSWRVDYLNITAGELVVGEEEYSIARGRLLIISHRYSILAIAKLQDEVGDSYLLILRGKMTAPPTRPLEVGEEIPMIFTIPESKLVREWLLSLTSGTLKRVA